jgi:hypothetical protein
VINEDVTLTVAATTGEAAVTAVWDFGDSTVGTGTTVMHRWTAARTYQVSVQATMANGMTGTTSVSITVTPPPALPAPAQLTPADNTELTVYPRQVALVWQAVTGAANYQVEVQCQCSPTAPAAWGTVPGAPAVTAATSLSFTVQTDYQMRWRVTAIEADGKPGTPSAWWQFKFRTGTIFDLRDAGPNAVWRSGAGTLPFNGSTSDGRGFAISGNAPPGGCTMEDGSTPSYLETHPQFTPGGWIEGLYLLPEPISGIKKFVGTLGYLQCGSPTQGIDDFVISVIMPSGQETEVYRSRQTGTDGVMTAVTVDLTPYAGANRIKIRVEDGPPNGQDWACWINAYVER